MTALVRLESGPQPGVRRLTLDDPDRRNAIGAKMREDLVAAVSAVAADRETRVLVVAGAGSAFCAGGDLPAMFGGPAQPVDEIRNQLRRVYDSFLRVRDLDVLTIAAVHGPAVGAGANLALCCDLRIAGPRATFGFTFSKLGLHPGGGATRFLVDALGPQRALAALLDGDTFDADQALATGLVLRIDDDPLAHATALAGRYAALDANLVRDLKHAVRLAADGGGLDAVVDFESWAQASSATRPEIRATIERMRRPR